MWKDAGKKVKQISMFHQNENFPSLIKTINPQTHKTITHHNKHTRTQDADKQWVKAHLVLSQIQRCIVNCGTKVMINNHCRGVKNTRIILITCQEKLLF